MIDQSRRTVWKVTCWRCQGTGFAKYDGKEDICNDCGGNGDVPISAVNRHSESKNDGTNAADSPTNTSAKDAYPEEQRRRALRLLQALAGGINPITGQALPATSPYQSIEVTRALFLAIRELEHIDEQDDSPLDSSASQTTANDEEQIYQTSDREDNPDAALLNALLEYRNSMADRQQVPRYFILSRRTIDQIVIERPLSLDTLLNIYGIGPSKQEKYGRDIIRLVNQYGYDPTSSRHLIENWPKPNPARQRLNEEQGLPGRAYAPWCDEENAMLTQLLVQHVSVSDIARRLQRQTSAIRSQIRKMDDQ